MAKFNFSKEMKFKVSIIPKPYLDTIKTISSFWGHQCYFCSLLTIMYPLRKMCKCKHDILLQNHKNKLLILISRKIKGKIIIFAKINP